MRLNISAKAFLLLALSSLLFFSCKKENGNDDILEGDPTDLLDQDHVMIEGRYGITAIFPKSEWYNEYIDTLPESKDAYFDGFRYNAVCASLLTDKIYVDLDTTPRYTTTMYFVRFHEEMENAAAAEQFIKDYKFNMYNSLVGVYYTEISEIDNIAIGAEEYEASHFTAQRGNLFAKGVEEIYLSYYNKRLYGVVITVRDENIEKSMPKCKEILKTVRLK